MVWSAYRVLTSSASIDHFSLPHPFTSWADDTLLPGEGLDTSPTFAFSGARSAESDMAVLTRGLSGPVFRVCSLGTNMVIPAMVRSKANAAQLNPMHRFFTIVPPRPFV